MHIAHFTNTYKPNINGVVRSVSSFRQSLTNLGHQVFIFSQDTQDYEDEEPFIFRYPSLSIPSFDYSLSIPVSPYIDWLLPSLKLDVIHSNHPVLLGYVAADKAEKLGVPLVFTFHTRYEEYSNFVPFSHTFVREIIVDMLIRYLERCQHIVTPSEPIREMLVEHTGISDYVTTVPTGIDLASYQKADGRLILDELGWQGKKILVSTGRLAWEKNWKTLLMAVSQVIHQNPDVRLILIGDGPQKEDLKTYCRELGISDQVCFAGMLPFDKVPDYLKAADLFCFASVSETLGLVTMEAMAAGLPVVAVNTIGTNSIVENGKEGILTENDPAALAQAMSRVLADKVLLDQFGSAASRKSKSFDMLTQSQKMLAVYERAIEDKKAGRQIQIDSELLKGNKYQLISSEY